MDEGLGSETRIDRPSSAKGARRRQRREPATNQNQDPIPQGQPLVTEDENVAVDSMHMTGDSRMLDNRSPSPPAPPIQGLV